MNCDMDGVLRKILFVSLFIYFLIKLYESVIKLDSEVSMYDLTNDYILNDYILIWNDCFPLIYFDKKISEL